ncbi:MAG: AbrB/MazE/SpoVT family DNA-binding domain-containing protein [Chloroflexia bacterium]|nr:AbrB/MazE/SpoVT family DNA-binding domain-containing protein [Chloroflexia bacterium]
MVVITRITKSGQLTMPVEVRRHLGVGPGDRVLWTTDSAGNTIVRPMRYTLEELDGILPAIDHPSAETDFEDMIAEAFEDSVEAKIAEFERG